MRPHPNMRLLVPGSQVTCGSCPSFPPVPDVGDFMGCGAEVMVDANETQYDSFIATLSDVAGFQFSIEIDGVLVNDSLVGDGIGGIAAELGWEVSAGAGNIVGVDLTGLQIHWARLTLIRFMGLLIDTAMVL